MVLFSSGTIAEYKGEPLKYTDPILNTYWIGTTIGSDNEGWIAQGTTFIHVLNDGNYNASGYYRTQLTQCLTKGAWTGTITKIATKTYFSDTGDVGGHLIYVANDFNSLLTTLITKDTSIVESNQYVRRNKIDVENIQQVLDQFLCH